MCAVNINVHIYKLISIWQALDGDIWEIPSDCGKLRRDNEGLILCDGFGPLQNCSIHNINVVSNMNYGPIFSCVMKTYVLLFQLQHWIRKFTSIILKSFFYRSYITDYCYIEKKNWIYWVSVNVKVVNCKFVIATTQLILKLQYAIIGVVCNNHYNKEHVMNW